MLRAPFAGLLVVLSAAHATAQQGAYNSTITDPEVKLRAGPSDGFPDTGVLRQGTPVVVQKEEGGWLAINAPQGSISWVQAQFIQDPQQEQPPESRTAPRNVFVETDTDVTIATGKVGLAQPLEIRRVKLPPGTELVVIGQRVTFSGKGWYPILPPHGDVRYVPKTAVRLEKAVNAEYTVRVNEHATPIGPGVSGSPSATPAGGPLASIPSPAVTPTAGVTASKPAVNHPLWIKAEAAERDNRIKDAEDLYFQLAEEMNRTGGDNEIVNQCFSRVHMLRRKEREARGTPTSTSATPTSIMKPPTTREDRGVRPGTPEPLPPAVNTAGTTGAKDERETLRGVLKYSTLTPRGLNGRLYMIESPQGGEVKAFVAEGTGVDLSYYVGRSVEISGSVTTAYGLRRTCIVATNVELSR
ncbi:Uncharacterized protein OS=Planctomyces brasiliensis (strain ATCC 49424 / DSM 5305 / JCM 21570 / NBRC 103401 / IFAM 1448) GN=Plabr_4525 PE=4 SV=1: SH3_3 [Gemmata massiliana]|uniref:SH3b domain-containing protein n=1 Tax=Gemmata massiliana TaxID=1210884 RepID=A0A6P2CZE6_9BACT|nr:SH3 domain-containing protein [Gemmata massiliana]VTR93937.1 Uncharacterized protein OS=Planctomyces brasiliensis (strain ATCC 49424 / DSM 5305 / JCM 21570 / NBRC 103401 / IFAM 1448) GN=Plabr_4525 PE=4 SV=1: SH3_3 [Gemmata massiliana]